MKDYFINLTDYIIDSYGKINQVTVDIVMDELELDVDMAIPIGLIVNELITNSLKYAFPEERKGNIHLALKLKGDLLELEVNDNGIGMQSENSVGGTGFGTHLVDLLVKQLDGKMILVTSHGTSVNIEFQNIKAA
jgi:two-component sensor histidine kinase